MPQIATDPRVTELARQVATARRAVERGDENTEAYAHFVINAILDRMGY